MVPFAQFKKREKHPWKSVNFSKVAGFATLLKLTLLHGYFSRFLNCTNGAKSRNAPHFKFMTGNIRRGNENEPIALEFCFGWVVSGYYESPF